MKRIGYQVGRIFRALSLSPRPHTAALILAGGAGTRMAAADGVAKQWRVIDGVTVLERAVAAFEACPHVDEIVVVVRRGEGEAAARVLHTMKTKKVRAVVAGGKTRQESAYRGAKHVSRETKFIAIHDAARCLVSPSDISEVISCAYIEKAASLGVPVFDTLKRVDRRGYVIETKDSKEYWLAATPQVFSYPMYISAATAALKAGKEVTDDNMLMENIGQRVRMVAAKGEVLKITRSKDLLLAEGYVRLQREKGDMNDDDI